MGEHTPAPTPSRGVYGFALYLACVTCFGLYIIWAAVPDSVLHSIGITYYPQKYWAIALPVYVMMATALFAFFVYPALNQLLTPPLDSLKTITDKHALQEGEVQGGEPDPRGIPAVADIHISDVCRVLYMDPDG